MAGGLNSFKLRSYGCNVRKIVPINGELWVVAIAKLIDGVGSYKNIMKAFQIHNDGHTTPLL